MTNYEYCMTVALRYVRPGEGGKVLDLGCGAGETVDLLRQRGVDAYGCDIFYEGGSYAEQVPAHLRDKFVFATEPYVIPFPDATFDLVFNNQVIEHVEDLERFLAEARRVLKPGGRLLSLFPDRSVWREGHIGIAFTHWFPKGSRAARLHATLWRALGFGYHKKGESAREWAQKWCTWLDDWTHYRSKRELDRTFARHFGRIESLEDHWLATRYPHRRAVFAWWPRWLQRLFVRKLGGLVFIAHT